ncbi:MAG: hypothetical protein E6778_19920 [Niallia nealsonii]|nr:hypothetical protein [Niallia nealsonii]
MVNKLVQILFFFIFQAEEKEVRNELRFALVVVNMKMHSLES